MSRIDFRRAGGRVSLALFAFLSRSLQQVSTVVITLLAASFLMPAEYGIYALGIVFIDLIQTLTYTGLYNFIVTSKGDDREILSTAFWLNLALGTIASAVLALTAYPLERLFDADELGTVLILFAAVQPFATYEAWSSAALLRRGAVQTNITVTFLHSLISLVAGVLLLWLWQSLFALVAVRYFRVFAALFLYLIIGRDMPDLRFRKSLARKAASYSGGLYGARLLAFLSRYAGDIMLGFMYSATEVGLYRFGNRIAVGATNTLTQPINSFAITQFGAAARADQPLEGPLARFTGTITLLTGMLGALVIVFAEELISNFFSASYLAAVVVTYAMALRAVADVGRMLIEPVFSALDRTRWAMTFNLVTAAIAVAAIFLAVPFGLEALAWTQLAVVFGTTGWAFYLMRWKGGLSVRAAVTGFILALILATCYGLTIELIRVWLVPLANLDGVARLAAGLCLAAGCAPLFLFMGWRLGVFTLRVFSG